MKVLSYTLLHVLLWGNCYYPYLVDVETEAGIH